MKKILIAGGTGLVGSRLVERLIEHGHHVHILSRNKRASSSEVSYYTWDINKGTIDLKALEADVLINLAGAGIADKRWTSARKKLLVDSRVKTMDLLRKGLEEIGKKPEAIICASAIGYYGDRNNEELVETSAPGEGFMADCCMKWEEAAAALSEYTDRHSILRIGIVLSTLGGALPKVLMTRSIRVLNYFGNGAQYYSYIHIDDLCLIIEQCISDPAYTGIINGVAPEPLTNKEFTQSIGQALPGSYAVLPAPKFGLRLALGEMADVVLNSNRVLPERLEKLGFQYNFPDLESAIRDLVPD